MGYVLQIKMWVVVKYSKYGRWGSSTSPLNNESTDMRGERRKQRSKLKNCRLEWGGGLGLFIWSNTIIIGTLHTIQYLNCTWTSNKLAKAHHLQSAQQFRLV